MSRKSPAAHTQLLTLRALVLFAVCCASPRAAAAEWLLTPFFGLKLGANTSLIDLDRSTETTSTTLGGSVMLLGDGPFGIEGDFGYSPGFFGSKSVLVTSSRVMTLTGNLVVATPVSITRDSLRPFAVAGIGLMDARIRTTASLLDGKLADPAFSLGGGALGRLSDAIHVRFEVRRFQFIREHEASGFTIGTTRLSFWRADVGLAFRY